MKSRIYNLTLSAFFTALIAVCAQLTIPFAVPFTMQTFAIYLSLLCIGVRRTLVSVLVYIALGLIGVPVFSSFQGGVQILAGLGGGFIIGFPLMILVFGAVSKILPKRKTSIFFSLFISTLFCYIVALAWYMLVFSVKSDAFAALKAFACYALPLLLPDAVKILLAVSVSERINRILPNLR